MFRTFIFAAIAVTALATALPTHAIGGWMPNGTNINGITLNGVAVGTKLSDIGTREPTGGASLMAIELPSAQ